MTRYGFTPLRPVRVFDLVDGFAADRGLDGTRPRPLGQVEIRIVAGPGPAPRWPEPGTVVLTTTSDGFQVCGGRLAFGVGERRRVRRIPLAGTYDLTVRSDNYEPVDLAAVALPDPQPLRIRLEPGPRYPFPETTVPAPTRTAGLPAVAPVPRAAAVVRGTLYDAGRRPIVGARVRFPGVATPAVTIATGDWLVLLPPGVDPPPPDTAIPVTLPNGRVTTTTYVPDPPSA